MEAQRKCVLEAKLLGLDGEGWIHPRQIAVAHEAFTPTKEELAKARGIVKALQDAQRRGLNVVSLGSRTVDPPVVRRAQRIARLAEATGMVE